jgi:hypothetical protein
MAQQPNTFELSGHGIQISYSTTSFSGKPLFTYHNHNQIKQFSGDEIQTETTVLGTLVTVTIFLTPDRGSTTFTLLVPKINLNPPGFTTAHVTTEGITTLHKLAVVGPQPQGQTEFYTVHELRGTATIVVA